MIFRFDEADLKHVADVIEAERRVRERLYHELKWNNEWSPSPASRITRIRRKGRPQSGKVKEERDTEVTSDEETPNIQRQRAHSVREESKTSRLKSFAIQIGDKSKNLALAWGENPSSFSIDLGDGTTFGKNHRHRQCCNHGVGSLTINTKSGGRSFQIENSTSPSGTSNVVIKSKDGDSGRRNKRYNTSSFHIENSTSATGNSNVIIKTTDADDRKKANRRRQNARDSSTYENKPKRSYRSHDNDKSKYSSTEDDSPNDQHRRRQIKYKQKRKDSSPEEQSDRKSTKKGSSKSKLASSDDEKHSRQRKARQKKKSESSTEDDKFWDKEDRHRSSEEDKKSTLDDVDEESEIIAPVNPATAINSSTQTSWMDTVADGPPTPVAEKDESPEYRKLKYFGEKRTHRVHKPAVADDYQLRKEAKEDFPLVVEVTRPRPKKTVPTDRGKEADTEVIHYIDKCATRPEYEIFEPVFVQPHSMWKPPPPRMKVEDFQPLEVYQYRKPGSREKYLVIANPKKARKPESRGPIKYKQRIEHNSCW